MSEDATDYTEQWEDLDAKVLLAQLLAEQQRTNRLLEQALTDEPDDADSGEDTTMYECGRCGTTVPEDDRESHARRQHNAPPGMVDTLFSAQ